MFLVPGVALPVEPLWKPFMSLEHGDFLIEQWRIFDFVFHPRKVKKYFAFASRFIKINKSNLALSHLNLTLTLHTRKLLV
jgi:hypothetical protein